MIRQLALVAFVSAGAFAAALPDVTAIAIKISVQTPIQVVLRTGISAMTTAPISQAAKPTKAITA